MDELFAQAASPTKSHGELIRSSSDDDIAEWVSEYGPYSFCDVICGEQCTAFATLDQTAKEVCIDKVIKWLASEVRESENY